MGDAIRRELAGVMPMPETRKARCAFSPDDRRNGRAQYIRGYWLEQKENRAILQKIAECVGSVNGIMPEIIMDGDRLFHLRTRLPNGVEDIAFPAGFPHAPYIPNRLHDTRHNTVPVQTPGNGSDWSSTMATSMMLFSKVTC